MLLLLRCDWLEERPCWVYKVDLVDFYDEFRRKERKKSEGWKVMYCSRIIRSVEVGEVGNLKESVCVWYGWMMDDG